MGEAAVGGLSGSDLCVVVTEAGFQWPSVGLGFDKNMVDKQMKGKGRVPESVTDPAASSFCPPFFCQPLPPASFFESLPRPLVVDPFCGGGSIPLEALFPATA